jgi:hypothetical protein
MTNFSSFFPAAGGGGGFTKMKKYSTNRALNDATDKLGFGPISMKSSGAISGGGQTSITLVLQTTGATEIAICSAVNGLVGYTFNIGYGVQTVTANTGGGFLAGQTVSFTPAVAGGVPNNSTFTLSASASFTVNPANDLGLSDGDSIGFFMVGAGDTTASGTLGAMGGKIIQGTKIISNASTDLVITPGVGANTASTISGGLTITTADGSNRSGSANYNGGSYDTTLGYGINGYGQGALGTNLGGFAEQTSPTHGFGSGTSGGTASDGAILIFH